MLRRLKLWCEVARSSVSRCRPSCLLGFHIRARDAFGVSHSFVQFFSICLSKPVCGIVCWRNKMNAVQSSPTRTRRIDAPPESGLRFCPFCSSGQIEAGYCMSSQSVCLREVADSEVRSSRTRSPCSPQTGHRRTVAAPRFWCYIT